MSKEREAFIAWAKEHGFCCLENDDDAFRGCLPTNNAWVGYLAASTSKDSHYQLLLEAKDGEIARLQDESESGKRALQFLDMQGYRRCSIDACNCPFWHGGNASDRLREIHDVLNDAGARPYQKTAIKAIEGIIEQNTTLKALLEQARETLEGGMQDADGCELNMSNYHHDDVHNLNNAYVALFQSMELALAAINAATGKGE